MRLFAAVAGGSVQDVPLHRALLRFHRAAAQGLWATGAAVTRAAATGAPVIQCGCPCGCPSLHAFLLHTVLGEG